MSLSGPRARLLPFVVLVFVLGGCGDKRACPGAQESCGGVCVDTREDNQNCGGCGVACNPSESCQGGLCKRSCQTGESSCPARCANLQNDAENCGACGKACAPTQACAAGQCVCATGQTACGDDCSDLQSDTKHCGTCGQACGSPSVCKDGACGCPDGFESCGGQCVDTQTSGVNCGGCGKSCPSGQVCSGGNCGTTCSSGLTGCGTSCVDLTQDPTNCGACGKQCTASQYCAGSSCVTLEQPKFLTRWATTTGWTTRTLPPGQMPDETPKPIEATFAPSTLAGSLLECRTARRGQVTGLPFTNCDGGPGTGLTYQPALPAAAADQEGAMLTQVRWHNGSHFSNVSEYAWYASHRLDAARVCSYTKTDAQILAFAAAQPAMATTATFDPTVDLTNPSIGLTFKQVQVPYIMKSTPPWNGTIFPSDQAFTAQTLRRRFVMSGDRKFLLIRRNFEGANSQACTLLHAYGMWHPGQPSKTYNAMKPYTVMSCDSMVLNANGKVGCINVDGTGTITLDRTAVGGWIKLRNRRTLSFENDPSAFPP